MRPLQIEEASQLEILVCIDACLYILHSSLVPSSLVPRHLLESSIFLLESVKESGYVSKCNPTGEFSLVTRFFFFFCPMQCQHAEHSLCLAGTKQVVVCD